MIIVRLQGGLGNQMFQYAFGRRLAAERDAPLRFDASVFAGASLHAYALDALSVDVELATAEEVDALTRVAPRFPENLVPRRRLPRFLRRGRRYHPRHHVERTWFTYDPAILEVELPAYFDGYWQSERYFAPVADRLREAFVPREAPSEANAAMAARIRAAKAVSLHVRRGDYVSQPEVRRTLGHSMADYYTAAVAHIREHVQDPVFFLFSDEPAQAAADLDLGDEAVVVDINGPAAGHEDIRLMSLCRHHVIANSSFSWWGAWLDARDDGIVVAPQRWMADASIATPDICPPSWVRL